MPRAPRIVHAGVVLLIGGCGGLISEEPWPSELADGLGGALPAQASGGEPGAAGGSTGGARVDDSGGSGGRWAPHGDGGAPSCEDEGNCDPCADGACVCEPGTYSASGRFDDCLACPSETFTARSNALVCERWSCPDWTRSEPGTAATDAACEAVPVRQFGASGFDTALALTVDGSGRVVVVGRTSEAPSDLGQHEVSDAFVREYDRHGQLLWARQLGSPWVDSATAVTVDAAGNVFVAGSTAGLLREATNGELEEGLVDTFIASFDASGTLLWVHQFGTTGNDAATGIAVGEDALYLVGSTNGELEAGNAKGIQDGYLRKYDRAGTLEWTRQFGTNREDRATAVVVDGTLVRIAGNTYGSFGSVNAGVMDGFIRTYASSGTKVDTWQFGTGQNDSADAIAVDRDGMVYAIGSTETEYRAIDGYVRQFDSSGVAQWTSVVGSSQDDHAVAVAADPMGGLLLAGTTQGAVTGTSAGSTDVFVRRYHSWGGAEWTTQLGTAAAETMRAVALSEEGLIFAAGVTDGELAGPNRGAGDAFVLQVILPE